MRSLQLALLTIIPAAALGAHTATRASREPSPALAAALDTAAASGGPVVRSRDPARVHRLQAALSDLPVEVRLGEAACSEQRTDTRTEQVRRVVGIRRQDNPAYLTASAAMTEAIAAQDALRAQADLARAAYDALLDRVEIEDARVDALTEEARYAALATQQAEASGEQLRQALHDAEIAGEQIRQIHEARALLEGQIRDLGQQIQRQEAALGLAQTAAFPKGDRAETEALAAAVAQAEEALVAAQSVRAAAQEALQGQRGRDLTPEVRATLRDAFLAAQAEETQRQQALEAARAALAQVQLPTSTEPSAEVAAVETLERELHHQKRALRRAEADLRQTPPPSPALLAQAAAAPELERQLRRQRGELAVTMRVQAEVEGRLALQQARAEELRGLLSAQTGVVEDLQANLQAQQEQIAAQEASISGVPVVLSETMRDEVRYPIETWTRVCGVEATVRGQDAGGETWTRTFGTHASDSDQTHAALSRAGIAADPLDYGRTDEARVYAADQVLIAQIRGALEAHALADAGLDFPTP